jgi:exopolysaccharide biosynthesis polyprenyl glycosylphosphotransferase
MTTKLMAQAILLGAATLGLPALVSQAVRRSRRKERVLILGGGRLARALAEAVGERPRSGCELVGVVGDAAELSDPLPGCPYLGPLSGFAEVVRRTRPDHVVVTLAERRSQLPVPDLFGSRLGGIVVEEGVQAYERIAGKVSLEHLGAAPWIFGDDLRGSALDRMLTRGMSLAVAALGLVLAAPLLAVLALAITLDSRGPVEFVQRRVGRHGRPFDLLKLRTMRVARGPVSEWAGANHDRITRLGRWLRKFRLDELPQFINVLRGDMDVVGPRPHPETNRNLLDIVLRNTPEWGGEVPYYSLRCLVRPGITGWAQVRYGYADNLEEEIEKVRYDLYYVKRRSFWLDLRILGETVAIVLRGRDAGRTIVRPVPASLRSAVVDHPRAA